MGSQRTLWNQAEDDALQGVSADAQVIYLRALRRHMNFNTGVVKTTYGICKRVIEFIADKGCTTPSIRVADITNDHIKARWQELDRAGLAVKLPSKNRFDPPKFRLLMADIGEIRPEYEPQENPKEGTPSGTRSVNGATHSVAANEPQAEPLINKTDEPQENRYTDLPVVNTERDYRSYKGKTQIPPDFAVTDEHRDIAKMINAPDPETCIDSFIGHHMSQGTISANWTGEFRKWLANQREFNKQRGDSNAKGKGVWQGGGRRLSSAETAVKQERELREELQSRESGNGSFTRGGAVIDGKCVELFGDDDG